MQAQQQNQPYYVYFDQNIIIDMAYGHLKALRNNLFDIQGIQLVYSNENLEELRRVSEEVRRPAIHFLQEVKAAYASMSQDMTTVSIDADIDPSDAFSAFCETVTPYSHISDAMLNHILKLNGGEVDESHEEIACKQVENMTTILDEAIQQVHSLDGLTITERMDMLKQLDDLQHQAAEKLPKVGREMDRLFTNEMPKPDEEFDQSDMENDVESALEFFRINTDEAQPPNVLHKVWEQLEKKDPPLPQNMSLEDMLGFHRLPSSDSRDDGITLVQKVNSVYGFLNMVGYYRDGGIKKVGGLMRSLSDMSHASYALCGTLLVCRDKKLVKKAVAAYEYLSIQLPVLWVKGNPRVEGGNVSVELAWPVLDKSPRGVRS